MRRRACAGAWGILVALAGCYRPAIGEGTLACASGDRCPRGFVCVDGLCVHPGSDGGGLARGVPTGGAGGPGTGGGGGTAGGGGGAGAGSGGTGGGAAGGAGAGAGGDDGGASPDAAQKQLGAPCTDGSECGSGFCADHVCCKSACTEACKACNLQASPGVCSAVAAGITPAHPGCATTNASTCQTDGTCDGLGACRMWPAGTACKPASCSSTMNLVTGEAKCDGAGACVSPPAITCAPYRCNATGTSCFATCTPATSVECSSGNSCVGGSCGTKPKGSTCATDGECTSQMCVDGVCCTGRCTGKCEACDLNSSLGDCAQVTGEQPHGTRGTCGGAGLCAGSCTAASRVTCTFPDATVTCRDQSCSGTALTPKALCNAQGACATTPTTACAGGLACNAAGTSCLNTCAADRDCATAALPYCFGGACTAARPNSVACSADGDCQSGHCADSRCCDSACKESCNACNLTGQEGHCTAVPSGQPHGTRPACAGSSPCQGRCDGSSPQCQYPGSETTCPCPGLLSVASCDGAGQCRTTLCI